MSTTHRIAPALLRWFDKHGRFDLPWQHPRTPYRVWLSEIMLQQTQVSVVTGYFNRFIATLPDLPALAKASQDEVLALWSGLGYYSRARNLHAAAQQCMQHHDGELPHNLDALMALPGIGRSTAGAILAQAWGEAAPILDGNVKRVFCRFYGIEGWPGKPAIEKQLWVLAEAQLPSTRLADYTQALMDLGATVCTRSKPNCNVCPLHTHCLALHRGRTDALPTPKPSKTLPQRDAHMLVIEDANGQLLLQRRPPTGIWGGLWSLPEFTDLTDATNWAERQLAPQTTPARKLAMLTHTFSHFRLHIHPQHLRTTALADAIGDNDGLCWVSRAQLDAFGLPAPIRKLLQGI